MACRRPRDRHPHPAPVLQRLAESPGGARRGAHPADPPAARPVAAGACRFAQRERAAVRSWEQGVRTPDGASSRLLDIAERHPEALLSA